MKEAYNKGITHERECQMAYFNNQKEPVNNVETNVWACINDDCQGWMREDYSFDKEPICPICQSQMEKEVRVLPEMK